jgi:glycosyltransferase involved in cell wall biosynthesis
MVDPLRIAYASPLPPTRSGIADYSAELLPPLAARAGVTLYAPEPGTAVVPFPVAPLEALPDQRWAFDLLLYHMGNSAHHATIYRMAMRYPGVVVLHDLFLHHFIAHTTAGHGDHAAYARELAYALGEDGRRLLEDIRAGRRPTPLAEVALNDRLLDTSLAIIVHSEFAREHVLGHNLAARVAVIPQLITPHPATSRRDELGLPEDAVLFGSVGQATAARQLPRVLAALRQLRDEGIDARFLVAGEVLAEAGLEQAIAEHALEPYVIQVGYVPTLEALVNWTATLDVVLNLRYPTLGETSASALRAMAAGRPIVVLDHGWYRELPDDAAVKLPAAPDVPGLADALRALAQDPARRAVIGRAALAYVDLAARPDAVAQAYVDFLRDLRAEWRHG